MRGKQYHGQALNQLVRERTARALRLPPPSLYDPNALRRARRLMLGNRLNRRVLARVDRITAEIQRELVRDRQIASALASDMADPSGPTSAGPIARYRLQRLFAARGI